MEHGQLMDHALEQSHYHKNSLGKLPINIFLSITIMIYPNLSPTDLSVPTQALRILYF